ncbi:hypothetical protein BKH41_02725 [Helicobacter sp. 12S02232-10]|uniref:phage protein GemA/Gp16 family protein n=1 Tax=Helicobacter sp. 12S02232-10 TaxID=1476197 RepID=UPI000BA789EC|nr:phage protein GemA/Gp16 family protein [Helicobacter sp. 12S02232-10]PAF49596.1 hypothetical protein BKH41_02725 [Helicobacter sp. 12S02232-10]
MTKKQAFLRKQLIIKIHTHPRYKEIKANGAWEDWLYLRYNEKSSALLSITELQEVVSILDDIGRDRDFALIDPDRKLYVRKTALSYAQKQKIKRLQEELGWSGEDLSGFIQRQIKASRKVPDLTSKEATKVITGLERTLSYNLKQLKSSEIYSRAFKTANNPNYKQ